MASPEPNQFATREEVDKAVENLSKPDWLRLRESARWRIRGLGRAACNRTADDLLSESLLATIRGAETQGSEGRPWNKKVDLLRHLTEAMRSISSHWKEQFHSEAEPILESDLIRADDSEVSPLESARSSAPDQLREAIAREELARIMGKFKDDDDAILVLEGWREGWDRNQFSSIGMSTGRYDATVKRIRYALKGEN